MWKLMFGFGLTLCVPFFLSFSVPSQCNLPKRVENAVITEKKREVYSDGDGVTYKCRTNYRMVGESIIRCQRGQWTPGTPTCIRKFFFSNGIAHKSRISCIATTKVVTVTPDRGRLHHGFALFFRTIISNFFDSGDQVIWLSFMPTLLLCS
jgi:hypothetical protein